MDNFGEYQLVPLSAEEQQLVQEVSALYIFLPGFNSMLDIQAKDRQHMLRCHKNNGVRNAKTLITRPIMAVTSNFSFDHFSVFYVCLIWSFIILLRPPEHKKHYLYQKCGDLISPPFMYTFHIIPSYVVLQTQNTILLVAPCTLKTTTKTKLPG